MIKITQNINKIELLSRIINTQKEHGEKLYFFLIIDDKIGKKYLYTTLELAAFNKDKKIIGALNLVTIKLLIQKDIKKQRKDMSYFLERYELPGFYDFLKDNEYYVKTKKFQIE